MVSAIETVKSLFENKKVESVLILISTIICLLSFILFFASLGKKDSTGKVNTDIIQTHQKITAVKNIVIDISGAVEKPGIYAIDSTKRVMDVIDIAGGLSENADKIYIEKNINRARVVQDQEKIYIPFNSSEGQAVLGTQTNSSSKTNINLASEKDLEALPGVGPTTAQKIIDARPYTSLDDLLNKKILKKNVYEQVIDHITY